MYEQKLVIDPRWETGYAEEVVSKTFGTAPVKIAVGGTKFVWSARSADQRTNYIKAALRRSENGQITVSLLK